MNLIQVRIYGPNATAIAELARASRRTITTEVDDAVTQYLLRRKSPRKTRKAK